jgi:cobalamin biosynthesis Mg chelatase CobN
MTIPTFAEQIESDMENTFFNADEFAETVTYERDSLSAEISAVFREATMDDLIDGNIFGEVMICYVDESDLHKFFERQPERGDTITRSLTPAFGEFIREETWTVVQRTRDIAETWKLVLERNIRLTP